MGQLTPQPVHSRQALLTLEEQHSGICKQATLLPDDFKQDPCPTDRQAEAEKDKGSLTPRVEAAGKGRSLENDPGVLGREVNSRVLGFWVPRSSRCPYHSCDFGTGKGHH